MFDWGGSTSLLISLASGSIVSALTLSIGALFDCLRYSLPQTGRAPSSILRISCQPSSAGSMAAEFFSLMTESSTPDNIREALASYDTPLFARSCNDQEELASLISHLMEASDTSSVGDKILARASVRLLFSRCRESCGLPPLDDAKGNQQPAATTSPTTNTPAPNAGSSWQESWPAKLSSERTAELRKRFEDDYPTELLDNDNCWPSPRRW